jgi:hypothetical protein
VPVVHCHSAVDYCRQPMDGCCGYRLAGYRCGWPVVADCQG